MATITSSCKNGIIVVMNAFINPADTERYLEATTPVMKEFGKHSDNLFVAVSINPTDSGHIRIVHGWTKDSAWFHETFMKQTYFEEFLTKTTPMWTKPRVIEHFDRYIEE